jgi:uncharacterized protein
MDTIPKEVLDLTINYINKLKTKIPVERVVIFGSYAKGNYTKESDIDIAVFSPAFRDMSRLDGLTFLLTEALGYKADLQPQPFTMDEYNQPDGLVKEIINTGIELTSILSGAA